MIERRRADRVHFVEPGLGGLRVVQDVEIARLGSHHAVVIADGPVPCGERLLLEIAGARAGNPYTVLAHVIDNRAVMDDGSLRRRVRLKMVQRAPRGAFEGAPIMSRRFVMGALIRRVPVRVVEASTSGCLVESPSVFVQGTVGFVEMRTATHNCSEAVRVRRTSETSNVAWPCRMAVEFLTLGPTSPDSLRGLATIMTVGSPGATNH